MAKVLLYPPPSLFVSAVHNFRNERETTSEQNNLRFCTKIQARPQVSSRSSYENGFGRREAVLLSLSSSVAFLYPFQGCRAEEELKLASQVDDLNAYSYLYPVELPLKKLVFKWVESRKPERYSSAAPLSPDARLRIVSERVDLINNLIISILIGPPNAKFLKSKDKSAWSAKDVADSVLSDKS